ncbi:MAG: bifunctional 3,4-dihydroxy-2-butanone-4-phosphate synthase/GTP cyclohydrolase II [Candidatus Margulisiibacteriota bacterium]
MQLKFDAIEEAVKEIKAGKMVIVVDDKDRENEGDLVMAAQTATEEAVNFMISKGKGLVCAPLSAEKLKTLKIEEMVSENTEANRTAFTVSVDAGLSHGVSTGISAADRAVTLKVLADPSSKPSDLVRPGHIFPLKARAGGVLKRAGHTEAAVDLVRISGMEEAAVICEIIRPDGKMARQKDLMEFSAEHSLKIVTIADLIRYRLMNEKLVKRTSRSKLPTRFGQFMVYGYEDILSGAHHLALVKGSVRNKKDVLVRVHSECLTGDVFGSCRCDCGIQLERSLKMIQKEGSGVLLYMRQEGRGIGLLNKLKAYELQDGGADTVEANEMLGFEADLRDYGTGAQILCDLGLSTIRLLTNNPRKIVGIERYGLTVVERLPIEVEPNEHNERYLRTKSQKLGHILLLHDNLKELPKIFEEGRKG